MTNYETKDSGARATYDSGMQRDTEEGKPRYDLVIPEGTPYSDRLAGHLSDLLGFGNEERFYLLAEFLRWFCDSKDPAVLYQHLVKQEGGNLLTRLAELMARGAEKYNERNWEKGSGPEEYRRARSSAFRHFVQHLVGDRDEDHAAAVVFNVRAAEYFQQKLPQEPMTPESWRKELRDRINGYASTPWYTETGPNDIRPDDRERYYHAGDGEMLVCDCSFTGHSCNDPQYPCIYDRYGVEIGYHPTKAVLRGNG